MLKEFQQGTGSMEKINELHLFLLPKCHGAVRVEDFRPISLSTSIYVIIAKVLANQLCEVIGETVRPFRSAFIARRVLMDSTVMAGEIIAEW